MRLALVLIALFAIAPIASAQSSDQPQGSIAIEASNAQDAQIAQRIRGILGELDGFDDITVTVTSGIVTLRGTTVDPAEIDRLNNLASRVEGVVAIENEVTETADVARRLDPAWDRFQNRLQQAIAFLPLALVAISVFVAIVVLGFLLAGLRWPWDRIAPNAFIATLYRQIVRLVFILGGLVVGLDLIGATALLGTILGAAGIVGLAIGFAVRDTVENFIASIMLSIRQPFRPNDVVEIEGDIGKVIRLTSRATILLSFDGNHIRLPNATVFKSRIVNYTRNDERRFLLELGVAYDTDLAAAQQLVLETISGLDFVLDHPAPQVWIESFGDSAVLLKATGWIEQHSTSFVLAKGEAYRACLLAFGKAGVVMPEPTYRVVGMSEAPPESPDPRALPAQPDIQMDVEAEAEHDLDEIVAQERAETAEQDLLRPQAPEE